VLKLILRNNGSEERHLISVDVKRDYQLEVTDGQGRTQALTKAGEDLRRPQPISISKGLITVKPSEQRELEIVVSDLYELTRPGTYAITAKRQGPHVDGKSFKLVSNKVTFAVE
jgi:hypothetical protein